MTNNDAIAMIRNDMKLHHDYLSGEYRKALGMAIAALEKCESWTPVAEALPEENDYKSCIECLDGAVWYFTENGTMGLGYYYKSTKAWATTDNLKTDGKVIAWIPIPEPYKAESEDKK